MQEHETQNMSFDMTSSIRSFDVDSLAVEVGEILYHSQITNRFCYGFCSDLMSDLLTIDATETVLITGLITKQTIRTAHIAEIHCIIFVRNKTIPKELIQIAQELDISIIRSPHTMFRVCGILYGRGVKAIY
ncbi:hypothetical protein K5X82_16815 [Halosquirtibacter xylanolyticus]|uniref:hypothetical protein n=1 Tax=Halosquirtibacter xylanolyticus TaxID=3374599 RepID=UPI0037482E00|nr:hypothetical protein K5X82_16815 [Prolixibacteraceae bacterium]